jgi:PST family polysaccharide transporter
VSSVSRYARGVAAYDLFNQIVRNGDNLLIGIVLGSSPLGFYNIGYQFLGLPVGQVSSVTTNVALPALSQMDDNERFKASLLRVQKVAVWCVAPIAIGAIVLGDAAVREVLGARWAPAGTLVQIFGAVALVQVAATQSGAIYLARRSTDLLFRWGRIVAPVFVISFLIGLPWGTVGVAVAYLVANLALFYPNWSVPGPIIGLRPGEVIGALRVELGLAVAIAVSGSAWRLLTGPPAIGLLLTVGASLALGYWLSAIIIDRDLRADVVGLLARRAMLEKVAPG